MPYEPLHHKYRPQKFADLVGQVAIATTLTNAMVSRRIAPAYLLTGPRGTGKTSSARIIAKSLNCLNSSQPTPDPCGKCEVCVAITKGNALDVIEIDAASNTGVDNIRDIIEKAQLAPVQARYKVYVIDECHMLSGAAFNALLKTLEEPPDRVIFILATTDPQRVLPTIISRCQRFDYRRIPLKDMVDHLIKIAKTEDIDIQAEAVTLVAQLSNGGLRDAESLLDQLSLLSGQISTEKVWDLVGAVSEQDLLGLIQAIKNHQPEEVIAKCRQLLDRGREPLIVLQNLTNFYLSLLIAKTAPDRNDLVALTSSLWTALKQEVKRWDNQEILRGQQLLKESEVQLKNTTQPRLWLEVALMGLLTPVQTQQVNTVPVQTQQVNTVPVQTQQANTVPVQTQQVNTVPVQTQQVNTVPVQTQQVNTVPVQTQQVNTVPVQTQQVNTVPVQTQQVNTVPIAENADIEAIWQQVLSNLHPPTTQSLVTQQCSLVKLDEYGAKIAVSSKQVYTYHQPKLKALVEAFAKVCQRHIKVEFYIGDPKKTLPAVSQEELSEALQAAKQKNQNNISNPLPSNSTFNISNPLPSSSTSTISNSVSSSPAISNPLPSNSTPTISNPVSSSSTPIISNSLPSNSTPTISNPVSSSSTPIISKEQDDIPIVFLNSSTNIQKTVQIFAKEFDGHILESSLLAKEEKLKDDEDSF